MSSTRTVLLAIFSAWATVALNQAQATIQSDFNAACSNPNGGTVTIPQNAPVITQTLNFTCTSAGTAPITVVGLPSKLSCNVPSASPCVVFGSSDGGERINLGMRDVNIVGPGRTQTGSVGLRLLASADDSIFQNIRVDGFDIGIHLDANAGTDLLREVFFTTVKVGVQPPVGSPTVNTAIHLDGFMGNVHFTNFRLSGWEHVIVFDGPAAGGAGASFTEGTFNTTKTPGLAAVDVSSTNGLRMLQIQNVQDWETTVPYLEMGTGTQVILDNIAITGDLMQQGAIAPAIHTKPGAFGTLQITNAWLSAQYSGANLMKLEAAGVLTQISNSRLSGVMTLSNNAPVLITNTWCAYPWAGTTANVRSRNNFQYCPDLN